MFASVRHGAVSAKARAMYGRRLEQKDYLELLKCPGINEILVYLKGHPGYVKALAGLNERMVHRGQLEAHLRKNLFEECMRLFSFSQPEDRRVIRLIVLKSELDEAVNMVMGVKTGRSEEVFFNIPEHIAESSVFDFKGLYDSPTDEKILMELPKLGLGVEDYSKVIKNFDLVEFQNFIYSRYYSLLFETAASSRDDRKLRSEDAGTQIDIQNMIKIYRLKKYYDMGPEEIKKFVMPFCYKLKNKDIDSFINAVDSNELEKLYSQSKYSRYFNGEQINYIEDIYDLYLYKFGKSVMRSGRASVLVPVAYLYLKDVEVRNLIAVIEGKRYGDTDETIRKRLTGVFEKE